MQYIAIDNTSLFPVIDEFPLPPPETDVNGNLRVWGRPCMVGWLQYMNPDGSIRWEKVERDALFDRGHLESLALSPATLLHPPQILVTPDSWKTDAIGMSGSKVVPNVDGGYVDILYVISDKNGIEAIKNGGYTELSNGYWKEIARIEDAAHDNAFKQTKRINNHHAFCPVGTARAGRDAKIYAGDSVDSNQNYSLLIGYDTISSSTNVWDFKKMPDTNTNSENLNASPSTPSTEAVNILSVDGVAYDQKKIIQLNGEVSAYKALLAERGQEVARLESNLSKANDSIAQLQSERDRIPDQVASTVKTLKNAAKVLANCDYDEQALERMTESEIKQATLVLSGTKEAAVMEAKKAAIVAQHGEAVGDSVFDTLVDDWFDNLVESRDSSSRKPKVTMDDQKSILSRLVKAPAADQERPDVNKLIANAASEAFN